MAPNFGDFQQLAKSDNKSGCFVLDSSTTTGLRIESRTRWRGWRIGWQEDPDGARRRSDAAVNRVFRNALAERFDDGFASRIASRHLDLDGSRPLSLRTVRAVIHEAETHISNEHVASEICGTGDEVRFQEMVGRARFPSGEYRNEVVTFLGEPRNLNAVRENLRAWLLCDKEMGDDGRKTLDSVQAVLPRVVEKLPELIVEGIRDHNRFLIDDFTTAAGMGFRGVVDEGFNQYAVSGVDPSLFERGLDEWIRKRITGVLPESTSQTSPRPLSRDEVSSAAGSAFREYLTLRIPHLRRIDDAFQGNLIDDFRKTQLQKLVLDNETFFDLWLPVDARIPPERWDVRVKLMPFLELVTGDISRNSSSHDKNLTIGLIADRWESMAGIIDGTKDFKPEDLAAGVWTGVFDEPMPAGIGSGVPFATGVANAALEKYRRRCDGVPHDRKFGRGHNPFLEMGRACTWNQMPFPVLLGKYGAFTALEREDWTNPLSLDTVFANMGFIRDIRKTFEADIFHGLEDYRYLFRAGKKSGPSGEIVFDRNTLIGTYGGDLSAYLSAMAGELRDNVERGMGITGAQEETVYLLMTRNAFEHLQHSSMGLGLDVTPSLCEMWRDGQDVVVRIAGDGRPVMNPLIRDAVRRYGGHAGDGTGIGGDGDYGRLLQEFGGEAQSRENAAVAECVVRVHEDGTCNVENFHVGRDTGRFVGILCDDMRRALRGDAGEAIGLLRANDNLVGRRFLELLRGKCGGYFHGIREDLKERIPVFREKLGNEGEFPNTVAETLIRLVGENIDGLPAEIGMALRAIRDVLSEENVLERFGTGLVDTVRADLFVIWGILPLVLDPIASEIEERNPDAAFRIREAAGVLRNAFEEGRRVEVTAFWEGVMGGVGVEAQDSGRKI